MSTGAWNPLGMYPTSTVTSTCYPNQGMQNIYQTGQGLVGMGGMGNFTMTTSGLPGYSVNPQPPGTGPDFNPNDNPGYALTLSECKEMWLTKHGNNWVQLLEELDKDWNIVLFRLTNAKMLETVNTYPKAWYRIVE